MRLTAFAMYLRTTGLTSRHLDRVQHGPAQQEPVKHKLFAEAARPPFPPFRFPLFPPFLLLYRQPSLMTSWQKTIMSPSSGQNLERKVQLPSVNHMLNTFPLFPLSTQLSKESLFFQKFSHIWNRPKPVIKMYSLCTW